MTKLCRYAGTFTAKTLPRKDEIANSTSSLLMHETLRARIHRREAHEQPEQPEPASNLSP